jgi:hypothetical protein
MLPDPRYAGDRDGPAQIAYPYVLGGLYVVANEDTLLGIGGLLLFWSLRQIWIKRFRGFLAVMALCAALAAAAQYMFKAVPKELILVTASLALFWAALEIIDWVFGLPAFLAYIWRMRPRKKRAARPLEPVAVAVPGQAGNVSAEEIIQRLVPTPRRSSDLR